MEFWIFKKLMNYINNNVKEMGNKYKRHPHLKVIHRLIIAFIIILRTILLIIVKNTKVKSINKRSRAVSSNKEVLVDTGLSLLYILYKLNQKDTKIQMNGKDEEPLEFNK